jgi:heme oxygenase (biliverdin-IX-beta and delta-forming)
MLHQRLRAATADRHERVDAAYSRFDLTDVEGYRGFLAAQARALTPAEGALTSPFLPAWSPRAHLAAADLAAIGGRPSPPVVMSPMGAAEQVGLLYVLEGSRLGAQVLAGRVPAGLPKAFLAAAHPPGAWRVFRAWLDAMGAAAGPDWAEQALTGARTGFDLFERAAGPEALSPV